MDKGGLPMQTQAVIPHYLALRTEVRQTSLPPPRSQDQALDCCIQLSARVLQVANACRDPKCKIAMCSWCGVKVS